MTRTDVPPNYGDMQAHKLTSRTRRGQSTLMAKCTAQPNDGTQVDGGRAATGG